MAMPKKLSIPIKWVYCLALVAIGFFGRAHFAHWEEDWDKPLPPHQVERYVSLVRDGDEATLTKLVGLAGDEKPAARRTAMYLLDRGGALGRLPRNKRVEHLVARMGSPGEFWVYEIEEPERDASDYEQRSNAQRLEELWQYRALVDPIAQKVVNRPGQLQYVLQDNWAGKWLHTTDRKGLTTALMNQVSIAAKTIRLDGSMDRQGRRRLELIYAVPVMSWLSTYAAYDNTETNLQDPNQVVRIGRALAAWWEKHAKLSAEERDALALKTLLEAPIPGGNQRAFAQWLMNRSVEGMDQSQWAELGRTRSEWSRLEWVVDGFREAGVDLGPPWEAGDVDVLIAVLNQAALAEPFDQNHAYMQANARWLLERLAPQPPVPSYGMWLGPLIGYRWLKRSDAQIQARRWSQWWETFDRSQPLRDPAEPLW